MDYLKSLGFDDSKKLTEEKRDAMERGIKSNEHVGWCTDVIPAKYLSARMLGRDSYNLNLISFDSAIGLVTAAIAAGVNVTMLYVDTVGDPQRYTDRLSEAFPGVRCLAAAKADALYPVVSAASIVAKVLRDSAMKQWVFEERLGAGAAPSREYGCGYPSDPATRDWLAAAREPVFGFPSVVRFSWGPAKRLLEEAVAVEWEADLEEEGQQQMGAGAFDLKRKLTQPAAPPRHSFFRSRKLRAVELQRT